MTDEEPVREVGPQRESHDRARWCAQRTELFPAHRIQAADLAKVHRQPFLLIPPCINKFYIP